MGRPAKYPTRNAQPILRRILISCATIGFISRLLLSGTLISIPRKNISSKIPISPIVSVCSGSVKTPEMCGPRIIPTNI